MTASINYLLNYINSDCFNKSHIDSKLIYNLKDEISRSIKICEIISLKMNEIKQITHNVSFKVRKMENFFLFYISMKIVL